MNRKENIKKADTVCMHLTDSGSSLDHYRNTGSLLKLLVTEGGKPKGRIKEKNISSMLTYTIDHSI